MIRVSLVNAMVYIVRMVGPLTQDMMLITRDVVEMKASDRCATQTSLLFPKITWIHSVDNASRCGGRVPATASCTRIDIASVDQRTMATTSSTRLDDMAMDTDDDFQSNGLLGMTQTIPEQTSEPVEDKHAGTAFEETGPPDEGNEDTPLQAHTESDQPPQEPETPSRLNVPAPFTPPALSDDPFTSNGLLTGALDLAPTETSAALHSPEQSHDLGIGSSTRPPTSDLAPRRLEIHAHTVSLPRLPPIEGRTASGKVIRFPRRRRAAGTTQRAVCYCC
jgi:hypothetical protein